MKLLSAISAAAVASALVIPDEQVLADLQIEHHRSDLQVEFGSFWDTAKDNVEAVVDRTKNALDDAMASVQEASRDAYEKIHDVGYDVSSWIGNQIPSDDTFDTLDNVEDDYERPPHDRRPPHSHKPNQTVYELIANSKYTTKLAALIKEDKVLVKLLNGTAANYTVFAPTDRAFEKIPHGNKPSKEFIEALLLYHISPEFYPAGRVLTTHTIPTLLNSSSLGDVPLPQRLAINVGLKGLTLNFYARVVAINIFGTNGVIHGLDSIILPPPKAIDIIQLLPSEFSTLTLGLAKTGLLEKLNTKHAGGTFFAPSNYAFSKLGAKINAFLFSKYGEKYLDALLRYHVVNGHTLYSDAYYSSDSMSHAQGRSWHVDLPTLLKEHPLSVDVGRYGPFIEIRINSFSRVTVQDGIARDGVIQVVGNVLIPPRKLNGEEQFWTGEEMSVDEFKERLEPFVVHQEM